MSQLSFDESTLARLEVLYRKRDLLRRRDLVHAAVAASPGERILDVGCGPGFYVAELAHRVGPSGAVVGVDGSPQMLSAAASRTIGYDNVSLHEADVTSLPVASESFDAALSVQVLEYVHDVPAALAEMRRALRVGGRVVLWDVDWATLSLHSSDLLRTDRVLQAWDGHLAHPSLPRTLRAQLRSAGFDDVTVEGHVFATAEFDPEAYGVSVLPVITQYVAGQEAIGEAEADEWYADLEELGAQGEFFCASVQFCFTARRLR